MLVLKRSAFALAIAAAVVVAACKPGADSSKAMTAEDLKTDAQKFGYAIGVDLGKSLQPVAADVDIASLKAGLDAVRAAEKAVTDAKEALAKEPANEKLKQALADAEKRPLVVLDDATREQVKNSVAEKLQKNQMEERTAAATKAKTEGEAFLAENAKKAGVKTTATGLQYEVLTEGKGDAPKATDTVTVHYKGTLINGETFDSSYDRGQPVSFPLQNVIPGWTEGLQLMAPGAKFKFVIPSALAYGERGAGAKIGPNSTLVFEVELLNLGEAKPAAEAKK